MKKCSRCGEEKPLDEFHKDKSRSLGVVPACKSCHAKYHQKRYSDLDVVNKTQENNRKYKQDNKSKVTEMNRVYSNERRQNDPIYYLIKKMRSRIWHARKKKQTNKSASIYKIIGCSAEELNFYLIETAISTYGSYLDIPGVYHIDHIIPLDSAISEEEIVKLCHYSNLQLLYPEDNLKKSNKVLT